MKHVKWPSINQYSSVVFTVANAVRYRGNDEDGNALYDTTAKLPTLPFEGTVKLHGTNAAICLSLAEGEPDPWCQSREDLITPQKDNAGFATAMASKLPVVSSMLQALAQEMNYNPDDALPYDTACIFGEWCGKGINKGVAIAQLPKMFMVFGMGLANAEGEKVYASPAVVKKLVDQFEADTGFKCIYNYPTFTLDIDFEHPGVASAKLTKITQEVERECPVGKAFGISDVGEGVVWRCTEPGWENSGYWFKVKGEKHSAHKAKTLAPVDVERMESIKQLAEYLTPDFRLEQFFQVTFDTLNGGQPDIRNMGSFIKAVIADVVKEEMRVISESGFALKDISSPISAACVKFFRTKEAEILS